MELEQFVAQHYTQGSLEQTILGALAASGKDTERLTLDDLAPVDEFHIGGRNATAELAAQLEIEPDMHLLDIGCGIGGASRYLAHERGCRISGIDLTQEYVQVAEALAHRLGLAGQVSYRQGSALDLPFAPGTFDGAYMLHVGMNIEDKAKLFAEVQRVLKPGGVFGIYDVMRETGEDSLSFPVPWSSEPKTSFVESVAAYQGLLESAGLTVQKVRNRRAVTIEFFRQMRARVAQGGARPAVGLNLLMGESSPQKIANMVDNLERGLIAPVEIICRRP